MQHPLLWSEFCQKSKRQRNSCLNFARKKKLLCICTSYQIFQNFHSKHANTSYNMTSLLTHNVAPSTSHSFSPKTNSQPLKKFLSLAFSWIKVVEIWMSLKKKIKWFENWRFQNISIKKSLPLKSERLR